MNPLSQLSATECVARLKNGDVSSEDLVRASVERIDEVNPEINALPLVCAERAIAQAKQADQRRTRGDNDTLLGGLPIAVKDYNDVGGVVTTYGSPLYRDYVPEHSDATVQMLEASGAIPIAKSNVPEWAGGHTFNPVYGATRNPWNQSRSAGGSSGGSAAALATGMVWLATGNDLGGSLRTPSAFNGVVGFRPGPGIVPRGLRLQPFDTLWVEGPMARNVEDCALMLEAGAGHHLDDPLSVKASPGQYTEAVRHAEPPHRIGFSTDLGIVPMAQEVAGICETAVKRFAGDGIEVSNDIPDFSGATDGFQTLRGVLLGTMMGELLETHRDQIAPDIIGNVELGINLNSNDVFVAERTRWELYKRVARFFETHDALICPTASIEAFPADQPYVTEIDGQALQSYIDWFAITFALTMTACPVISVPCGLTAEGLPVAVQIMGKPRHEAELLGIAKCFEQSAGFNTRLPLDPKS